jgi:hypothetical protein
LLTVAAALVSLASAYLVPLSDAAVAQVALPPGGTFVDDDGLAEEGYIEAIAAVGVTLGCNPPANDRFCPGRTLARADMATFLVRALDLPPTSIDFFADVGGVHEPSINALAQAGITIGCGPGQYCPAAEISRQQLATFLVRALGLPASSADFFSDDDGSVHEEAINALHAAGLSYGASGSDFFPRRAVLRSEMAAFVSLALGLQPLPPPLRYPDVGEGQRIIYENADQRVWLIDADGFLVDTYLVSGREGVPAPGTYSVFSKSVFTSAGHGGITMEHMVRFAHGATLSIGFHAIPRYRDGTPMQTEAELGQFRSAGCVRQSDLKAAALYAWAPVGTPVYVLP